jgi:uncharacterized protein YacL
VKIVNLNKENMQKQSKRLSLIESIANTSIGLIVSFLVQLLIFPHFGIIVSHETNLYITLIFFVVSFARGYIIRRVFNRIREVGR